MDITKSILAANSFTAPTERISIADLITTFQDEIDYDCNKDDINHVLNQLLSSQHHYVKFGLIIEKIRNQSLWKYCVEKFESFKEFCMTTIYMTSWQAKHAIASAQVNQRLRHWNFEHYPKNASQALVMAKLDDQALFDTWQEVLRQTEGRRHKITAALIESIAYPDKIKKFDNVALPTSLSARIRSAAIDNNVSTSDYLDKLMLGEIAGDGGDIISEPEPFDMKAELADLESEVELSPIVKKKSKNFLGEIKRLVTELAKFVVEKKVAQPIVEAITATIESLECTLLVEST